MYEWQVVWASPFDSVTPLTARAESKAGGTDWTCGAGSFEETQGYKESRKASRCRVLRTRRCEGDM